MKIEEAIEKLKNEICDYVIPGYCNDCERKTECLDDCNFILAIYTVLQEIERLQKENEEYSKQLDLDYVDKNFVSKDKIREIMNENGFEVWTREYGNVDVVSLDSLNDLLKEE